MKGTFVFEKVAHPSSTSQYELSHVFHNLGFGLGGERLEPFGESDLP